MLEGIVLSVAPPYILVLCQSFLECAACPRIMLSLSSWYRGGAGGCSSQCSRSDCSRPSQNYLSAVNNLWPALLLLFLHPRATLSVGCFFLLPVRQALTQKSLLCSPALLLPAQAVNCKSAAEAIFQKHFVWSETWSL